MRFIYKRFAINLLMYGLIALVSGGIVYFALVTAHQGEVQQQQQDTERLVETYKGHIDQLSKYIYSLKSRVQHLAVDNRRLSQTGVQLVEKIAGQNIGSSEKLQSMELMQQELVAIDSNIIEKYTAYIMHQESCGDLKVACKKGSSKSKKCEEFQAALEVLDGMGLQLKYLKAKREVLISGMERQAAAL